MGKKLLPYAGMLGLVSKSPIYGFRRGESSKYQVYREPIVLKGSTLLLFDAQIPYQDGDFIYNMLELARAWKVKQGISGGDFFNQACFSFFLYRPEEMIWHEEAESARKVTGAMAEYIPSWLCLLGNHDVHVLKQMKHQINHEEMLRMYGIKKGFTATDYYWCLVEDAEGNKWRISHPRNSSIIHGRVPTRLATKYQQNIVAGHGHLAGMNPDDSGKFLSIDAGVVCDPERLDYNKERDNVRPEMNRGAVILKEVDGRIYPYHILPEWADWDALKRMYK